MKKISFLASVLVAASLAMVVTPLAAFADSSVRDSYQNQFTDDSPLIDFDNGNLKFDSHDNPVFSNEQINEIKEIAKAQGIDVPSQTPSKFSVKIATTKIALKAAKWILSHRAQLTNEVGHVLGRKAAVRFGAALKYIEGPLRKVTAAENGGLATIQKIIYNGLRVSGVSAPIAQSLAAGIRGIISFLI
ncbi:hypothetical protein [Oenococcus sicerae]|uniref:Uncharacterized protein n=1 Tax=Oenococcus sicerae TaxID=2203724 RepID=A0AAJ1R9D6_9LACO|nr:hypothetical protein [Oenococcus sicerae]MDN6900167.1 hypothetical protein [Oenococcus sicerae]